MVGISDFTIDRGGDAAGPDAQSEGGAILPVTEGGATKPDADDDDDVSPNLDAGPRPDAHDVPAPAACYSNVSCPAGSTSCFLESCSDDTTRQWPTMIGGSFADYTYNICRTKAGQYAETQVTAPSENYRFLFHVVLDNTPPGGSMFAVLDFGGGKTLSLQRTASNNTLQICRSATPALGAACAGTLNTNKTDVTVYGRASKSSPYASAVLAGAKPTKPTSTCDGDVGALELDGPLPEKFTARVGSLDAASGGQFNWYDARIELTPE